MIFANRPRLRAFALALVAVTLAAGAEAQQQGAKGGGQEAPTAAGYMVVTPSDVPVRMVVSGRAVAQNATQLRPRVGGSVTAILYTPGTLVQAGTPLFSIDPLTYQVALATAEAENTRAAADLRAAEITFDRVEKLQGSASSRASYDDADVALQKARATLAETEANLNLARAQLDWTTVRAPLTGIVGVAEVAVGDLVTANQSGALAEIVQVDPVHVDMAEPYPLRLKIDAQAARGEIAAQAPELTLILDDGRRLAGAARLISTGATVSTTTGTRSIRFEVGNPDGLIAPGMFLHGEMVVGHRQAFLIPQRATQRERDGTLTAWIAADGKAAKRKLTDDGSYGNAWVVVAGVAAGDWLLIDGTSNLREGQAVAPVPAQIDDQGVVRDTTQAQATPAPAAPAGN